MASNKAASPHGRTQSDTRLPFVAAPRLVPAAGYRGSLRSVLVGPSVTPRIMRSPAILVFDSGVGGLTVFREIARTQLTTVFLVEQNAHQALRLAQRGYVMQTGRIAL